MKKFLLTITAIFMCIGAHAKTETINWYMDGNTYATTQCETGSDIILPQTPYKYGYTFNGWIANYIPIEYLESTGTQYIDTGNPAVYGHRYILTVKYLTTQYEMRIAGSLATENGIYIGIDSSQLMFRVVRQPNIKVATVENNKIYRYDLLLYPGNNTCKITDLTTSNIHESSTSENSGLNTNNIYLFDVNYNGVALKLTNNNLRIYDYKVLSSTGEVLVDMIPVLDQYGTPCMYDKVEKKFYYNAGTGQFIAGPVIEGE